jgi:hypothetical protein
LQAARRISLNNNRHFRVGMIILCVAICVSTAFFNNAAIRSLAMLLITIACFSMLRAPNRRALENTFRTHEIREAAQKRPVGIVWFERVMFGTLVFGAIQSWMIWPSIAREGGTTLLLIVDAGLVVFIGGLTLLVSRRRSNIAKWVFILVFVIGFPFTLKDYIGGQYVGAPLIGLIQSLGQLGACALLFTDQSRRWFRRDEAGGLHRVFK